MQGSRVAKVATVGVLTTLFLGGMWVVSGSQNPLSDGSQSSFTVPGGHYGDHAEYFLQDDGYGPTADSCANCVHEVRRGHFSWDFYGPGTTIDRHAQERTVVYVDVGLKWSEGEGSFWGWPLKTAMDVDTREVIRYQEGRSSQAMDLVFPYTENHTGVHIGPLGQGYAPDEMHRIAAHAQGLTFHVGEDLSRRIGFFGPPRGEGHPDREDYGQSVRVLGKATLDGATVWGIQVDVWESETEYWDRNGLLTTEHEWSNVTFWFSESSPVPLRMDFEENGLMIHHASGERKTWHAPGHAILSSFRPGTQLIPWGVPSISTPPPQETRVTSADFPRSGQGWRGAHRIEDALAAVESDPTLVDFSLWKQANPGARLIGYEGRPSYTTLQDPTGKPVRSVQPVADKVQMWRLYYSAPFGDTILMIESSRDANGVVVNRVPERNGESVAKSARFDPAWMPHSFVTSHSADPFYKTLVAPSLYERGPNYVRWGYFRGSTDPERYLDLIVYGRVSDDSPLLNQWRFDVAVISAQTGEFKAGSAASHTSAFTPVLGAKPNAEQPRLATGQSPSRALLAPFVASAASASLVILLAVYLFPILQQGAVGLYTKLVKHQLLDNALRDQLVTLIRENPGISPPALKHLTGAGWTTVVYHLSVLGDNNLITSVRDGRHRRYFLVGTLSTSSFKELAVLRNQNTKRVFELVRAQPGIDRGTLGRLMSVHTNAVVWHIDRLLAVGLVRATKRGRFIVYSVARPEAAAEIGHAFVTA